MIHTVKGFGIINKADVDVFLEFSCFFYDPMDVGNLISGSSGFSKSSLYMWKFSVYVLLKPSKSFKHSEHYLASRWNECKCVAVGTFLGTALLWDWNENWPFPICGHCWYMEKQKILNSQRNLENEKWSWRNQLSWLETLLQSYSHLDSMVLAQKRIYRPMEQDRKPRDKPTHLWAPYLWQKRQEYAIGQR